MSDIAIRVENLSKRYRVGALQERHNTLRDHLAHGFLSRVRGLSQLVRPSINGTAPQKTEAEYIWALRDVSFEIQRGEVVGIIGRNGAGKTTILKVLSRITAPTSGRAEIHGRVGSLLEVGTGFHAELSGRENVYLNGAILGMKKAEIDRKFDEIVEFAGVEKFIDTPMKRYSSGMQVRLAFAVAAHLEPEILLVDEVLAVGDINFRRKCLDKMRDVSRQGLTVLFVSHDMSSIRQLCQRVLWLEGGRLHRDGAAYETSVEYEAENYRQAGMDTGRFDRRPPPDRPFYIEWVELRDSHGSLQTQYRYGETLDMLISLRGDAPQDGFTVVWYILNERGDRVALGAANPITDLYLNRGDRLISCRMGPLPLTKGTYRFWFSVLMWGRDRWDEWDSPVTFQVAFCDPFGTGYNIDNVANGQVIVPQAWTVVKQPART